MEQIIFYAEELLPAAASSGLPTGSTPARTVLVALALPPAKLYYLVCDFGSKRVTVFENAVRLPEQYGEFFLVFVIFVF